VHPANNKGQHFLLEDTLICAMQSFFSYVYLLFKNIPYHGGSCSTHNIIFMLYELFYMCFREKYM